MLIALVPFSALAASAESESVTLTDTGTQAEIILINDLAELKAFRDSVNGGNNYADKYIKLTANITIGESDGYRTPIGHYDYNADSNRPFSGTFDGDGYEISGLRINNDSTYQGLFGHIGESGTYSDQTAKSWTPIGNSSNMFSGVFDGNGFEISGIYIDDPNGIYMGIFGVAGQSSVIKNLNVTGSYISANRYFGTIAGQNNGAITGCTVGGRKTESLSAAVPQ